MKKLFIVGLSAVLALSAAAAGCHTHTFASEYSFDETHHWREATCCENVVGNKNKHGFANGICDTCGFKMPLAAFKNSVYGVGVDEDIALSLDNSANVKSVVYSEDSEYVSIDETGTVHGESIGTAQISASVTYIDNSTSEISCQVEVNDGCYETLTMQESFVKWVGRNFVRNDCVNFFNTASGFETTFYGTQLKAELTSAGDQTPRICVLIDGETSPSEKIIDLSKTKSKQEIVLASGLAEGYHTVKVYKITEALHGSIAVNSLQTDGFFYEKPAEKPLKIEVYGDSISTGYKNLRNGLEESDVSNENMQNGCLTYAWLAAQSLNAEISVMAREGIGMSYSYGASILMKNDWNKTYCAEKDYLGYNNYNPTWNFDNYIADVAIINVGSNDYWWSSYNASTYKEEVSTLCKNLLKKHGDGLKIVLVYGMMTSGNGAPLEEIAARHDSVYAVQLDKSAGHHPRINDHINASITLTNFLQSIV